MRVVGAGVSPGAVPHLDGRGRVSGGGNPAYAGGGICCCQGPCTQVLFTSAPVFHGTLTLAALLIAFCDLRYFESPGRCTWEGPP